jgi:prepilin-type N-terminal cleavage/methylation domain-containing protein
MHARKGFTFIELMMVVVVVAIVIVSAMSGEDNGGKEQARMAAELFESDVAYARSASIARPDSPLVIKVDTANNRYWLAPSSNPNTPITHPRTGQPYIVSFGAGGTTSLDDVTLLAADVGTDQVLAFNSTGSTDQQTPALLQLKAGAATAEISVAPASGKTAIKGNLTKLDVVVDGL